MQSTDSCPPSPFLRLPPELRALVYDHVLPTTTRISSKHDGGLVWLRGHTALLATNRQLSEECLELLYGRNTFVVECSYDRIDFRFRWLLPSNQNLAPNRAFSLLDHFSPRNMRRIKNYLVHVEQVDSYTGMVKYNCGGSGLTAGLREQVRRLVDVMRCAGELHKVTVRFVDKKKKPDETQVVLEPLLLLSGVRRAIVTGGVAPEYADYLQAKMHGSGGSPTAHQARIPWVPGQRRAAPPLLEKILLAS